MAVPQPLLPAVAVLFWINYNILGSHYLARHTRSYSASDWLHPALQVLFTLRIKKKKKNLFLYTIAL